MLAPSILERPVTVVLGNDTDSEGADVAEARICGKDGRRYLLIVPDGVAMAQYNGPKSDDVLTFPKLNGYFTSTDGRSLDFLKHNNFQAWNVNFDTSLAVVASSLKYIEKGMTSDIDVQECALKNVNQQVASLDSVSEPTR